MLTTTPTTTTPTYHLIKRSGSREGLRCSFTTPVLWIAFEILKFSIHSDVITYVIPSLPSGEMTAHSGVSRSANNLKTLVEPSRRIRVGGFAASSVRMHLPRGHTRRSRTEL
jgi:hypothetical protein